LEHGIAVPHGKTSGVTELTVAVGISHEGIYFDSIDGKPAKLIFLVLSSPDQAGTHIAMLKDIAFFVNDETKRDRLLAAKNPAEIVKALRQMNT
jgi:mannitol/fructose-specific phosphotransferase system IIA component (Ntr-type)